MNNFSLKNIYKVAYLFKNFFKKKHQKWFYDLENYKNKIRIKEKIYYIFYNYVFRLDDCVSNNNYFKKISKIYKEAIIIFVPNYSNHTSIFNFKNKYYLFNYSLDKKKYNRKLYGGPNFLKLNLNNANSFKFKKKTEDVCLKPFYIKKKTKKKLVLLLMADGLGADLANNFTNCKKFFSNRILKNAWTNSDWTLPTFGNLITGKYTSNHLCYNPKTFYNDSSHIFYNCKKNIFEKFKDSGFITGCYSGYVRINPTYESNRGVDIFKYCKNLNTSQVLEEIYAQIKLFESTSNFIFGHLFDTHGPVKNENFTANDFAFFDKENFHFTQTEELRNKGPKRLHYGHDEKKIKSALKQIDWHLFNFLNTLNEEFIKTKKFDDFTIIVFGDHGTRVGSNLSTKTNNTLNNSINHISMMIYDKKMKKINQNKLVETIDIFPSLAHRYNLKFEDLKNKIDGKNTIFSEYTKKFQISESVYDVYDFIIRNQTSLAPY